MLEKNIQNNNKQNKYHKQGGNKQWLCIVQNVVRYTKKLETDSSKQKRNDSMKRCVQR